LLSPTARKNLVVETNESRAASVKVSTTPSTDRHVVNRTPWQLEGKTGQDLDLGGLDEPCPSF
jgi:hypothetical protein